MLYASAVTSYDYASTTEKGKAIANRTRQHIETVKPQLTVLDILINNIMVSLPILVPIAGFIFFFRVIINTGAAIGYLAFAYQLTPLSIMTAMYIPIGIIENLAYSILMAEMLMILITTVKHRLKERLKQQTWKSILTYLALLALGAVLEIILINL